MLNHLHAWPTLSQTVPSVTRGVGGKAKFGDAKIFDFETTYLFQFWFNQETLYVGHTWHLGEYMCAPVFARAFGARRNSFLKKNDEKIGMTNLPPLDFQEFWSWTNFRLKFIKFIQNPIHGSFGLHKSRVECAKIKFLKKWGQKNALFF